MTAGCDRCRLYAAVTAVLLAVLALAPAGAAPSHAGPATTVTVPAAVGDDLPGLAVDLTSVTPSALQPGTPLELRGRVVNVDDHIWRRLYAYLVISPSPLTTRAELAAAADSPAESYFGDRIIELGRFDRLGGLSPGELASFQLRVPWSDLEISGLPGVYTVGVQVIGTDLDGSRPTEGRVRTFVPLVDRPTAPVRLALVWPLEGDVLRRPDGTYARAGRTVRAMSAGGRLKRMVDLARSAASTPVTVVPDPALLDAAADVATGSYGPPGGPPGGATGSADEAPDGAAAGTGPAGSAAVSSWFDDTMGLLGVSTTWLTGYGDPAADTLAAAERPALTVSVASAGQAVRQRLLTGQERVFHRPRGGVVAADTLAWLRGPTGSDTAALSPRMLPDWDPVDGAVLSVPTAAGPLDTVVDDPALSAGGPAPGEQLTALQVRQRLLAETALLGIDAAAAGQRSTTAVFVAPPRWDPGPDWPTAFFFTGLEVPWLRPVPLDDPLVAPQPYAGAVGEAAKDGEQPTPARLPEELVTAAAELDGRVRVLTKLVAGGAPLTRWYDAAVALGVSSAGLREPEARLQLTERGVASVRRALGGVTVSGSSFVTLSSTRGRFPLTVTNTLERTVTVSVAILTEDAEPVVGARFDTGGPVTIRPGRSESLTVDTRVGQAGVTSARAYLVTKNGRRFGTPLTFSLRTSVVGTVIWVILGVACVVLAFAITRRLVRRVRGQPR